ncbi:SDR family oxidoreductase [Parvularcula sp. IMCC14364]|uniref:SDR family NAD(P)-dependent oxidoreductase n=1 Tax=Parvularcula sp. IMCC14364 TaxID=3067902 RepID=UPI0027414FCF|nr:SDR family NAD(P)-dependent oxidoreductase [Parvularcula sp. IMCC14364]
MSYSDATFAGQTCVITGAASGIGRALAVRLGKAGAMLALSDVNEEGLAETAALAGGKASNKILTDRLDMADAAAIKAYAPKVKEAFGSAQHVMNVAGLARVGSFEETDIEAMEKVVDVNFWGVVRMSKAFLPQLIESKGHLTNISSVFGFIGYPGNAHYCASKFAVRGFSETIGMELKEKGVQVHSVHPGGIDTNIVRNAEIDALPDGMESRADLEKRFESNVRTSADEAAAVILKGLERNNPRILIGPDAHVISATQRLLPRRYAPVLGWIMDKWQN